MNVDLKGRDYERGHTKGGIALSTQSDEFFFSDRFLQMPESRLKKKTIIAGFPNGVRRFFYINTASFPFFGFREGKW
jgi:hypothetical protein